MSLSLRVCVSLTFRVGRSRRLEEPNRSSIMVTVCVQMVTASLKYLAAEPRTSERERKNACEDTSCQSRQSRQSRQDRTGGGRSMSCVLTVDVDGGQLVGGLDQGVRAAYIVHYTEGGRQFQAEAGSRGRSTGYSTV